MRQVLIVAAALALAGAPAVLAQDHDHGGDHPGGGHPGGGGHPSGGGHPPAPGGGVHGAPPQTHFQGQPGGQGGYRGPQPQPHFQGLPGGQGGYRGVEPNRQGQGGPYHGQPGVYRGGYPGGGYAGGGVDRGGYGHGYGQSGARGFNGPGRFSYRGRTFSAFQVGAFRYPPGWGYRRWAVGGFLPGLFLGGSYFIGDWGDYDLGPPPPEDHWVRYGSDALLVNNYTGQIDDVVYGVFYG